MRIDHYTPLILSLQVVPPSGVSLTGRQEAVILFNPYLSGDGTYMDDAVERGEYLENTVGVLFQGLSDNWEGHVWQFDQFAASNIAIALRSLRRLAVADRGDIPLVSRHLTYAVGADICYGKWGDGSYRTGRPSGGYTCASPSKCYDKNTKVQVFGPGYSDWSANCCAEPGDWQGSTSLLALHKYTGRKGSPPR